MMDELDGMTVFVAVAEAKGFRAAGERLGVSGSAVSQALRRLEGPYGPRNDLPPVNKAVGFEVRGFDPVLQHRTQLEQKRRAPAPDEEAAQPAGMQRGGKVRSPGPDIGAVEREDQGTRGPPR